MEKKEISFENIKNFLRWEFSIYTRYDSIVFDLENSKPGFIAIKNKESDMQWDRLLVNDSTFVIIIKGEAKDASAKWQEYLGNSNDIDMHIYYESSGSRFG